MALQTRSTRTETKLLKLLREGRPANLATWRNKTIRAEVLVAAVLESRESDRRPLMVSHANIQGVLDIQGVQLGRPIVFEECNFTEKPILREAQLRVVRFAGGEVPGLDARQLRTDGDLEFGQGLTATAAVVLAGAHIGGRLVLSNSKFLAGASMALDAAGITVDQEMFCDGDFTAKGEVSIAGARLRRLSFRGADLAQSGRMGADIAETLECDRGFKATGQIHLENANIGGALSFCGAELKAEGAEDSDRISLNADLITVGRSVDFGMWVRGGHYERFRSEGEVRVICAHIHGQLECHGAWFKNEGRESLIADGLVVDYDAFLDDGFSARGKFDWLVLMSSGSCPVVTLHLLAHREPLMMIGLSRCEPTG